MTAENNSASLEPESTKEVRRLCEVNAYSFAKIIFHILRQGTPETEVRAALSHGSATALIDSTVYEQLGALLKSHDRNRTLARDCNPWVEPDCPDMLFD